MPVSCRSMVTLECAARLAVVLAAFAAGLLGATLGPGAVAPCACNPDAVAPAAMLPEVEVVAPRLR
jgi:hypothetical protein